MSINEDNEKEVCVSNDGLIAVAPVEDKSDLDNLMLLLERREGEARQAAEYGLGLLISNEELQIQVTTLKIQLETEKEELLMEKNMWKRRAEHARQETVQWKNKYMRVEEEKILVAEAFEQFVNHCECQGQKIEGVTDENTRSSGQQQLQHLDTIDQLQTELQIIQALERSKEAELKILRQWKSMTEQQQQEALECEALTAQTDDLYRKEMDHELSATQRDINELKIENDVLRKAAQQHETEIQALKQQLRVVNETRDDTIVQNNRMSEELLSSESRCKRLQRELELLEHISYFSQALVDRDDEESDEDDEAIEVKDLQTVVVSDMDQARNIDPKCLTADVETWAIPSSLRTKRRRPFLVDTASSSLPCSFTSAAEDCPRVQVSRLEQETHKKLHHYFHLTALSIIHENNLIERCFSSSSRLTIDMWYHEVIAKKVPFLMWHSWLIDRISDVAASVQDEDTLLQRCTSSSRGSSYGGAFHKLSFRKISGSGDTESVNASPPSSNASASPASSPVARVPFTAARAFFRLLRKSTRASAGTSPDSACPAGNLPAR